MNIAISFLIGAAVSALPFILNADMSDSRVIFSCSTVYAYVGFMCAFVTGVSK